MTIEFRCKHGFLRSHAPCEQCGDHDPSAAHDARNNRSKAKRERHRVLSKPHGPKPKGRGERASYARRERRWL
jgi:hypothetical protein